MKNSDKGSKNEAQERIVEEHKTIRALTDRVEQTRDLQELLSGLLQLQPLLERHFDSEEAPGGLYEGIRASAPQHDGKLKGFCAEHREFCDGLKQLVEKTRMCLEGPVAEILSGSRKLLTQLREHEAEENELFIDSVYTDLGQGD